MRESLLSVEIQHLDHGDGLGLALHHRQVDFARPVGAAQLPEGEFADEELRAILLARRLQAGGEVDPVADDGEVHPLLRADVARHHPVGVQADADIHRQLAFAGPLPVPGVKRREHCNRRAQRAIRVVLVRHRDAESRHHRVANELVEHALFLLQAVDHQGEVLVQQRDRPLRAELLGERGKPADIGKQHGRLDILPAEQVGAGGQQPVGNARVHVARHRRLEALFGADVFEDDHRADALLVDVEQRLHGEVD